MQRRRNSQLDCASSTAHRRLRIVVQPLLLRRGKAALSRCYLAAKRAAFFAARFERAQRFRCASAILCRPSALMPFLAGARLPATFLGVVIDLDRAGCAPLEMSAFRATFKAASA